MRRALLLAGILSVAVAAPVAAAAPNDTPATARSIVVGQTVTQDTTDADATDPAETALNGLCGAPTVEHGVWFTITPAEDTFLRFDASASGYPVGFMLFVGEVTAAGFVDCGPEEVAADLIGDATYFLMAFGFDSAVATSGALSFDVAEAVPAPEVEVTIDPVGFVSRGGLVHLTGTATCTSEDGSGTLTELFGDVSQRVGRLLIHGSFATILDGPCDGSAIDWDAFVLGDNGVFGGGKAASVSVAIGCTDDCTDAFAQATVQLKRSGR